MASLNTAERKGQVAQALFFIRTLAGKLNEGWEMLQRNFFNTGLAEEYGKKLSPTAKHSLTELERYFCRKENYIKLIRNKFAFHYDTGKIRKQISATQQREPLEMYVSEYRGSCLYYVGDIIVNWAILNSISPSNPQRAMALLIDEIAIKVPGWFQEFGGDCISIIGNNLGLENIVVEAPAAPLIDEVRLPYFVRKAGNNKLTCCSI